MAKTKAERMRAYREKKKQELGEAEWLRRERIRTKAYKVPMEMLDEDKKIMVREQNRKGQERFRQKKKQQEQNNIVNDSDNDREEPSTSTQSNELEVTSTSDILTVKLPSFSSAAKGKKRVSRALSRAKRRIETLEDKNETLTKKLRTAQKRLQRYDKKKQTVNKSTNTPKSKTDRLLRESGIDPQNAPEIRKKLIFAECLSEEVRAAKEDPENKSKRCKVVHRVAAGKVMKKYRMMTTLYRQTSLSRKRCDTSKSIHVSKKTRLKAIRNRTESKVIEFLEREDNSRLMPGKADAVKEQNSSDKIQKRVLNDFMYNLHQKFLAESDIQVSRATFYNLRPKYISPVNFASRSVCLCSKHQNFSFLLRSMKTKNLTTCQNPDKFVEQFKDRPDLLRDLLEKSPDENIRYQQWKRVKQKNGKERQRVVDVEKSRNDFIEMVMKEFDDFEGHVQRVKNQYVAIRDMKNKLPKNQVLVQMDFSENYTCNTLEEIQSAYWNSCMVTLHPTVVYENTESGIKHTSYVFISEVLNHNATMVITIIDKLMVLVKNSTPDVEYVHFWTDSPSSQYRNKTIFDLVSRFKERYGINASWHYFEAGHGKGPCDGVGGTTKRNADNAVKQGKVMIQDAQDFYAWASSYEGGIKYELVTEEAYNVTKTEVEERNTKIKPLKGSMSLHAVIGLGDGQLLTRATSCACDNCFIYDFNAESNCIWNRTQLEERVVDPVTKATVTSEEIATDVEPLVSDERVVDIKDIEEGSFVVAKYDGKNYIGQVVEICPDKSYFITFMADSGKKRGSFKWPSREDKILRDLEDIVQVIEEPVTTTKTGRLYSVPDDVLKVIYGD